jgi:hypothetical protein
MVQAYHAVSLSVEYEDVDGDNGRPAEHEGSALLGGGGSGVGLVKSETQKEGHATLSSSIVNLSNTIIGSGASPLPPILPSYPLAHESIVMTFRHAHLSSGTSFLSVSQYIVLEADLVPVCNYCRPSRLRASSPAC